MNYTKEITEDIVATYQANPCRDTVNELARKYDKPIKSIIGKLSKEGVYRRETYKNKSGEEPVTKESLKMEIAMTLNCEPEYLFGLEKASKLALTRTLELLKNNL